MEAAAQAQGESFGKCMRQGRLEGSGSGGEDTEVCKGSGLPAELRPASGASVGDAGAASLPDFDPTSDTLLEPCKLVSQTLGFFFSSFSGLSCFVRASLRDPVRPMQVAPQSDLWPIPPPQWRWHGRARNQRAKRKRLFHSTRARLLQVIICSLNWKTLGYPKSCPPSAKLGAPISLQQHKVIDHLEGLVTRYLRCPSFLPEALGRCGPKFASFCSIVRELPKLDPGFADVDSVAELVQGMFEGFDKYGHAKGTSSSAGCPAGPVAVDPNLISHQNKHRSQVLSPDPVSGAAGLVRCTTTLAGLTSLKVTASRIKWKHSPDFNPLPFISDRFLKEAYLDPELLRMPREAWPATRPALVHADRNELLALARLLDQHQALAVFEESEAAHLPRDEEIGLFSIRKDNEWDRLIMNPTVVNARSFRYSNAAKALTPGWMLTLLHAEPHEGWRFYAADLSDFYHSFRISKARALRNRFRARFSHADLAGCSSVDSGLKEPLMIGLGTMAMGDALSVEVAQSAHTGLLQQTCGSMLGSEVLRYRAPVPRTSHVEALAIDDHISLQRLPLSAIGPEHHARDSQVFELSCSAYESVGLHRNVKKDKKGLTAGVVLGAELDGVAGVVSAPRDRVLALSFISSWIAHCGAASPELLDSLVGSWVHVLLFRRPLFCIIEALFREGAGFKRTEVFALSPQARNELFLLSFLGGLGQADLRAPYNPSLYALDASPWAGAICTTSVGCAAASELWRHAEQRGYYTRLASPAAATLAEHGIEHVGEDRFGDPGETCQFPAQTVRRPVSLSRPLQEGCLYDCIELGGSGSWAQTLGSFGLTLHPLSCSSNGASLLADLSGKTVARDLIGLAARRVVREWHISLTCFTDSPLKRPRRRTACMPAGVSGCEKETAADNRLARVAVWILATALSCGQYVSVQLPAGSKLLYLHCFRTLAQIGCVLTTFCFCTFGSPFRKRVLWLHNKPWVARLQGGCSCERGQHFSAAGARFDEAAALSFKARCRPDCLSVYGVEPRVGDSIKSFASALPLPLARRLASGSFAARTGAWEPLPQEAVAATQARFRVTVDPNSACRAPACEPYPRREWHEDPEWISEICSSLHFRELFRYNFKHPGHINVNEARVFKSWVKSLAKTPSPQRAVALLDSRVTIGAAAKGRSSSFAISRVLSGSLGYIIGSGIYPGLLHCRSADNRADEPSRDRAVLAPTRQVPRWLQQLLAGDWRSFDLVVEASCLKKIPARWLRFLLLLGGDIERNPGPRIAVKTPRGPLDLEQGFAPSTMHKMRKALEALELWLLEVAHLSLEQALSTNEGAELALRGFGLHLYAEGHPRYLLVYAITAIQNRCPSYRNRLSAAWQVDKKWQDIEPGECRPVLPAAAVRALLCVTALWGWLRWSGLVLVGFLAMLHPTEMVQLLRKDLAFPSDALGHTRALYVHLRKPKTQRFARRQHGKIDDPIAIRILEALFGQLAPHERLFAGSMHSFRKLWDAGLQFLGIPCRAIVKGATPGVLRGSGATFFYQATENVQWLAWRGRWARVRTLEYYLQEVAAQLLLTELGTQARYRIAAFDSACDAVLCSLSGATQ